MVCISPLTSLMIDQHAKYTPSGLITEFVAKVKCDEKAIKCFIKCISPESVMCNPTYSDMFLSLPYKKRLIAPAVDEARCVKTWGMSLILHWLVLVNCAAFFPSSVNVISQQLLLYKY